MCHNLHNPINNNISYFDADGDFIRAGSTRLDLDAGPRISHLIKDKIPGYAAFYNRISSRS